MTELPQRNAPVTSLPSGGKWTFALVAVALVVGCGDASPPSVPIFYGTGGSGGAVGAGGMMGSGGMSGTGGVGGFAGAGGGTGIGGGGNGGTGGTGGSLGPCVTDALCHTCPTQLLCETDDDCEFSGYVCVPSGCETHQGAPIKQCQPLHGGSCGSVAECPNDIDYECIPVGASSPRCVRVTPGCTGATESYDCPLGFSCQAGGCVDRRVPCDSYLDCPKSHVCKIGQTSSFCARVFQTCHQDGDCDGSSCADVDGDGTEECVGQLEGTSNPCTNSACASSSAPVCEAGVNGTTASCGQYGLCRTNNDCDTRFSCVGLWQDGRKECVPTGGSCSQVTECPLRQVCAAPRTGGPPSCQAGSAL
jgi:hypothetical protein